VRVGWWKRKRADFYQSENASDGVVIRFSSEPSDYTTMAEQAAIILGVFVGEIRQILKKKGMSSPLQTA